jgi:predicted dehydrogenase
MATLHRVLVIGGGSIGERHVRCFQSTGRAAVSLCEIDAQVRERVATTYNLPDAFSDFDAAIDSRPTAAVICTPAHLHVSMAIRLADAGVRLLIEKPLSTSLEGIDRLIALAQQRNIVSAVAYVYRAHPVLRSMREAIHAGRFGLPLQLVYVGGQHFPYFRPAYREIYYTRRETGGGAIQDALTHVINAGEWLVGPVMHVAADAGHLALEGVDVEDTVHAIARHGAVMASYALNQHQAANEGTLTVICDGGTVRCELHEHRWRWKTHTDDPWHDESFPPVERDTAFVAQADAFLDAIEGKRPPLCTLAEGLQTLRVNLALLAAADTRTWQTIST